jgi:hypothetical protein
MGGDWRMNAQIPQHFILPHFAEELLPHFAEEPLPQKMQEPGSETLRKSELILPRGRNCSAGG